MYSHKLSPRVYVAVFAALMFLTLTTVGASALPLGKWHAVIALGIAGIKASLVILFFMHALYSSRLTQIVIVGALLWLGLLIGLTMTDYLTRPWLAP